MLSKHPLELPPNRKLSKEEIKDALRLSAIAELDAVSLYLQFARSIEDERIRKVFEDVAREEKAHVGEFLALLESLDPEQVEELKRGKEEVAELTGIKINNENNSNSNTSSFMEIVSKEVKRIIDANRVVSKKFPLVKMGRGVDAVPVEMITDKLERTVIPLCEISAKFRVSQRALDYATRTSQLIEAPEAIKAAIDLAYAEDKYIVETIINCKNAIKLQITTWDEPGASVIDVVKAISELSKRGFRKPYVLVLNYSRYTKLLSVSEKTGITDLERIKTIIDEIVVTHLLPDDKVMVVSSTPEVLDIVYSGDGEVDYIGPENGFHAFRTWSTLAVRIRNPAGIVIMETPV